MDGLSRWLGVRPEERGQALLATATLFVVVAGHAMRETARDALFLADLPATRLPWAYLAIAGLTLAAGGATRRLLRRVSAPRLLAGTLALGAAADAAFFVLAGEARSPAVLFLLYVWTGLLATTVTMQLWLHLTAAFDVRAAKRVFPRVAAGGLAGAVAGASAAGAILLAAPTRALLLGAGLLFVVAAWLPRRLEVAEASAARDPRGPERMELGRALFGDRYLRRILTVAACVGLLATGADYVFKEVVASQIDRAGLGDFFARFHAGVNTAALLFQVALAPWILQRLGVIGALAILPAALLVGAGAVTVEGGLAAALLLKGGDGTLRHSVHGPAAEILYLPLGDDARHAFKAIVDALGQRGGQALASLGILLALALGTPVRGIALALLVVAAVALLALVGLRRDYVGRFRAQLRAVGPAARADVPRLDLHALEVLVETLGSPHDGEVLAALDLLEAYGRGHLVSPLILHHPSREVVLRALALLEQSAHPHRLGPLERLLDHEDAEVRAAALGLYGRGAPDPARVDALLRRDPAPAVRATALLLRAAGRRDARTLGRLLDEMLETDVAARRAVAAALPRLPAATLLEVAPRLARDRDDGVVRDLAESLAATPRQTWIPLFLELLARRPARPAARRALVALGEPALDAAAAALRDPATEEAVRRHLPRTLSRFAHARAAACLVEALDASRPRVRYKILRGLGRMRADDPSLAVEEAPLLKAAEESLERAVEMLAFRVAYAAWAAAAPHAPLEPELLGALLEEKEHRALERVFRVLHILEPGKEFATIFRALRGSGEPLQAGAREVLEHLVEGRLRDGMLAMARPDGAVGRLRAAARDFSAPPGVDGLLAHLPDGEGWVEIPPEAREEVVAAGRRAFEAMARDRDPILRSVARRRVAGAADG